MLIVFEGLDGSGKSTLARRTAEALGADLMTTPSPSVRRYRDELLAELGPCQAARQLFYMATVFAASCEIAKRLDDGRKVVIDRYFLSTQAYAEYRGSPLRLDELSAFLVPATITLYLDAPLEARRARVHARGASVSDVETLSVDADGRLRELHHARRSLPIVGRFEVIDTASCSLEASLDRVLRLCDGADLSPT